MTISSSQFILLPSSSHPSSPIIWYLSHFLPRLNFPWAWVGLTLLIQLYWDQTRCNVANERIFPVWELMAVRGHWPTNASITFWGGYWAYNRVHRADSDKKQEQICLIKESRIEFARPVKFVVRPASTTKNRWIRVIVRFAGFSHHLGSPAFLSLSKCEFHCNPYHFLISPNYLIGWFGLTLLAELKVTRAWTEWTIVSDAWGRR